MKPEQLIFSPVRPRTAFDETLLRLQSAIKLGLLPPGSRLPAERDLCTQLGISRSTLRQALTTLGSAGYLHATRGRGGGTFVVDRLPPVPPPSETALAGWRDLCKERLAIELGVVVLAARLATADSVAPLERLANTLENTKDFVRYAQLDRQFHIAIAEQTQCKPLIIASIRTQAAINDLLSVVKDSEEVRDIANAGHRTLIAALMANDDQAALTAMCAHLNDGIEVLDGELDRTLVSQPAL